MVDLVSYVSDWKSTNEVSLFVLSYLVFIGGSLEVNYRHKVDWSRYTPLQSHHVPLRSG